MLLMLRRLINLLILAALTFSAWYINLTYQDVDLDKLFYTLVAITVSYFVFKFFLEEIVSNRMKDSKSRYTFRKTTYILFIVVSGIVTLRIWIINPQALLVAYGLIAAGVAISLQDVFKNFAGALAILMTGIFRVGDRIEVNGKYGDVIDIGLFYTSLLELGEWVDGDQATGRIALLPNGHVLFNSIQNYTKDHQFIWDEISIPITYDSDWKKAGKDITDLVKKKTADITKQAEQEVKRLQQKYFLSKRNMDPVVFVTPTDNWIMLKIRYVSDVRERRLTKNNLSKLILAMLQKSPDIHIASQTLVISQKITEDLI